MEVVVTFTPWPFFPREGTPVPIEMEAGWAPEPVWTFRCRENLVSSSGIRNPGPSSPYPSHDNDHFFYSTIHLSTRLPASILGISCYPRIIQIPFYVHKYYINQSKYPYCQRDLWGSIGGLLEWVTAQSYRCLLTFHNNLVNHTHIQHNDRSVLNLTPLVYISFEKESATFGA
jgi:hypothetical protein